MEKNMEGRTSQGVLKCLLSQACAIFLKLELFGEHDIGLVSA